MRISEFCNTFQISHQAVYAKIKKYAAELEGHISKDKGNVLDLDSFAVNLLKPKKASYEQQKTVENAYMLVSILYKMCKVQLVLKGANENEMNKVNTVEINAVYADADKLLANIA